MVTTPSDDQWWDHQPLDPNHWTPETLNPYPDRSQPLPGARQSEAPGQASAGEFTEHLVEPRSVVHPVPLVPDQVLTTRHHDRHPDPFTAPRLGQHPVPDRSLRRGGDRLSRGASRVVPWTSIVLAFAAQAVLGAALAIGVLNPAWGAVGALAMFGCGLILIAAEGIHRTTNRSSEGGPFSHGG